ncbi:MAG: putative sulfate exporter family transporter, partial [Pedobacter sp.]
MSEQKKLSIHEDWVVVILGALIIFLSIAGLLLAVPSFGWSNVDELTSKVLSGENIGIICKQFLYVGAIAALGAMLTGRSIANTLKTFPIVYILTVIALILTGNSQVKALNLEAVIFSLAIGLLIGNFLKLPVWFKEALSTELFV